MIVWISIIKPQIAQTTQSLGTFEVIPDCLNVTQMEVAIWFRWESKNAFILCFFSMASDIFR